MAVSMQTNNGESTLPRQRVKSDDDLMTEQLRTFIDEVMRAPDRVAQARETDPELAAQSLNRHLLRLLELQNAQIERAVSRLELDNVSDARYLKVALADELLLRIDWLGRERWTGYLLESSLYRTNIAGDQIFQRIDTLLGEREPSRRKMARLYLFALAMGFEGRYRGASRTEGNGDNRDNRDNPNAERLRAYRQELFQFIYQRRPDIGGRDRVIDEDAYAHTLSHLAPRKLPQVSRWLIAVLIAIAGLLAFSEILWLTSTWPVRSALNGTFSEALGGDAQ